jgi:hypothetical protein
MSPNSLFQKEFVVGIFRGFSQGGLEFHADLVMRYRSDLQNTPMHGLFLVVQLESEREAVLGRISSFFSDGRLASGAGEDFNMRAVMEEREIPEDLREQYLKYRVNIRVLGVVREMNQKIVFAASHRRLPHVGSKVARLPPTVLQQLVGHNDKGAELGFYALGEFIYAGNDARLRREDWMQVREPATIPRFDIHWLVSRRTMIFARAGYGKSNLNKLLFSTLYSGSEPPSVLKEKGEVPVGTILFDPDGEYFWPDNKGRPGLCDVEGLQSRLVVFTSRTAPSPFYESFVASEVRLDIRRLRPADVISIALSPEKQDQQNVNKLKAMSQDRWIELVNAVAVQGNLTDLSLVKQYLHLRDEQEAEASAALSNMTRVVKMLHDPGSRMLDALFAALKEGCLCVVDVSQMRGESAFVLSGIILRKIFEHNQEHFTGAEGRGMPALAVVEEAQAVLGGGSNNSAMGPYVEWVKEGRKYDLGAVLVTQRPGSISDEILSQGDNWFVFHLLSARDLAVLRAANAHFSEDLLSSLLNEPLKGHGIVWSSESPRPIPVPVRIMDFAALHKVRDPDRNSNRIETWAVRHETTFEAGHTATPSATSRKSEGISGEEQERDSSSAPASDAYMEARERAIERVFTNENEMRKLRQQGLTWGRLKHLLKDQLPESWPNRDDEAYWLVKTFMEEKFGAQDTAWHTTPGANGKVIRLGGK